MNAKARILVIDDEEIVRLSYVRALSTEHCSVEVVADGKGAIRMMRQQPFDVVLLDLHMPEMDGMNVLETIKDQWPESEVIIITGYPAIDTAKKAVALGAYDYLAKPVGPEDVTKVANDAMMHKRWALRGEQRTECTAIQSRASW